MADEHTETGAPEVCRNFRNNGHCRYGDNCRFEHTEGEPIQVPSKPPGQCFKFQESECSKGDRCRFMHGEDDPRFDSEGKRDVSNEVCNNFKRSRCALGDKCLRQHVEPEIKQASDSEPRGEGKARRQRRPRQRGPKMCRNFSEQGECPEGDGCRFKHGADDTRFADDSAPIVERRVKKKKARKPRGECFEFRDNGACERGDECRFRHGENDTRFPADEDDLSGDDGEDSDERKSSRRRRRRRPPTGDSDGQPINPAEKIDEECNNYKQARCRFGDDCRRLHTGDVTPVPIEKIDEICNNFQNGRCRFGDFCRRQHIAASN